MSTERERDNEAQSREPARETPLANRVVTGFFVTGTDTGVGKSVIATALVRGFVAQRLRVAVMKPVASGSQRTPEGLRNEDALALMAASNVAAPYSAVNPYCFEPPISPHIAAQEAAIDVNLEHVRREFGTLAGRADVIVVEGAGGWLAPIRLAAPQQEKAQDVAATAPSALIEARPANAAVPSSASIQELALTLELPVLLVVGMRLGCINHARLTKLAIEASGARFAGWVANTVDPAMARPRENLDSLVKLLGEPPLAVVPWQVQGAPPLALTAAAAQLLAAAR